MKSEKPKEKINALHCNADELPSENEKRGLMGISSRQPTEFFYVISFYRYQPMDGSL